MLQHAGATIQEHSSPGAMKQFLWKPYISRGCATHAANAPKTRLHAEDPKINGMWAHHLLIIWLLLIVRLGEIIYDEILPNKRMSLHLKIAQILEDKPELTMSLMQQIGQHYSKAKLAGKAFWFLSQACLHLWEQGVAGKALDLFSHDRTRA